MEEEGSFGTSNLEGMFGGQDYSDYWFLLFLRSQEGLFGSRIIYCWAWSSQWRLGGWRRTRISERWDLCCLEMELELAGLMGSLLDSDPRLHLYDHPRPLPLPMWDLQIDQKLTWTSCIFGKEPSHLTAKSIEKMKLKFKFKKLARLTICINVETDPHVGGGIGVFKLDGSVFVVVKKAIFVHDPISLHPLRGSSCVENQSLLHPHARLSTKRRRRRHYGLISTRSLPIPRSRRPVWPRTVRVLPIPWTEEVPFLIPKRRLLCFIYPQNT